jgi:hypothetical protein
VYAAIVEANDDLLVKVALLVLAALLGALVGHLLTKQRETAASERASLRELVTLQFQLIQEIEANHNRMGGEFVPWVHSLELRLRLAFGSVEFAQQVVLALTQHKGGIPGAWSPYAAAMHGAYKETQDKLGVAHLYPDVMAHLAALKAAQS